MKILQFIKSFVPRIDRESVLEDIGITKTELSTGVLPAYQTARTAFKTLKLKSKEAQELQKVFNRNYTGGHRQENLVADISEALPLVLANLEYIETQTEQLFSQDILRDGLSVRKAVLLRAADQIYFISKFSIDLLNVLYVLEAEERGDELAEEFKGPKRNLELVTKHIFIFAKFLKLYSSKEKEFQSVINDMPDTILNNQTADTVMAVYKEHELDPMAASMVMEFDSNPIYHIRLAIAEWQANRYKRFADKKKMLELRLLHLKMMADGKPSDSLEREIAYVQGRVDDLDYKLAKMAE